MKKIFTAISALVILFACEDPISVDVEQGEIQLAVDAFLSNQDQEQKIVLLETKQFFEQVQQVPYEADSVYVKDSQGNMYLFEDTDNDGEYIWDDSVLVHPNETYNLTIKKGNLIYSAETFSNPVPTIDSINWEYQEPGLGDDNGSYAVELVARDLIGQTDYYWIRYIQNGKRKNSINNLNIAIDNSNVGLAQDGGLFIPPTSTFSAFDTDDSLGLGDIATYEIWSITLDTYGFWAEVSNQALQGGGIGALFQTPIANVKTNITVNSNDLGDQPVGWFSTSLVSSASQEIIVKEGEKLSFSADD